MSGPDQQQGEARTASFSYSNAIAPMMWVFVGLASIELIVVHFLLSFWSSIAALVLSVLTLLSILWLVSVLRSFGRLPVLVGDDCIVMRVGTLRSVRVEPDRVAGLRSDFSSKTLKAPGVLNLALIAYPNVVVDLSEPLPGRKCPISAIAHRLDDPVGFARAVEELLSACTTR